MEVEGPDPDVAVWSGDSSAETTVLQFDADLDGGELSDADDPPLVADPDSDDDVSPVSQEPMDEFEADSLDEDADVADVAGDSPGIVDSADVARDAPDLVDYTGGGTSDVAVGASDPSWNATDDSDDEASAVEDTAAVPTRQRSRRLRRGREFLNYDRMGSPRVTRYTLMALQNQPH